MRAADASKEEIKAEASVLRELLARGVPGDLLEAGVFRGGATIFMRALLAAHSRTCRTEACALVRVRCTVRTLLRR